MPSASSAANKAGTKRRGSNYAYAIVASCIAIIGIPCALVLSCAGIYFRPVSQYFGVSTSEFTLYFSILNAVMMVTLPIDGKIVSTVDARIVYSACVAIDGVTYCLMSQVTAVWQFYVAGAMLGVGTAPLIYFCVPTLINAWFKKRAGFFIGLCMSFTGIGGVIFNQVGSMLIGSAADGWRSGYLTFGIIMLAAALPFTVFVVRSRPSDLGLLPYGADADGEPAAASDEVAQKKDAPQEKTSVAIFAAVALFSFLITLNQTVYQFLSSYCSSLAESLPQLAAYTGAIASSCMAGQAIGKVILGAINDRSVRGGMTFGIGSGIVGVLLMMLFPQVPALLMAGAFLFGFVYACTTVQVPLLTRKAFPDGDYTTIYSRVSTVGALGSVIATMLWSFVIELPGGYVLMFCLSIACMVCAYLLGSVALRSAKAKTKAANSSTK